MTDPMRIPVALLFFALSFTTALLLPTCQDPPGHPLAEWLGEDRRQAEITLVVENGPIFHEGGVSFDARLLAIDTDVAGALFPSPVQSRVFYPTDDIKSCEPLPLPGDTLQVWARLQRPPPREFTWRRSRREHLEARGITVEITILETPVLLNEPLTKADLFKRHLAAHRIRLERRVGAHLDSEARAIAVAMLTGSRGELTPELRQPFDITSTGHILAISGLHFATIAALVAFLLSLILNRFAYLYLRWPRRTLIGLGTLMVLTVYLFAIGAPVSAQRAYGMCALAIALYAFSPWRISALSALFTTAGILLILRPSFVFEVGFQLSLAATAGICLFLRYRPRTLRPPLYTAGEPEPRLSRWRRQLLTFAGVSLSATIATWPVLLRMTGELPLAGLWTNLVVVPLVSSLLFPLLVAGALLTSVFDPLAALLLQLSTGALLVIRDLLDLVVDWPGTTLRRGTPTSFEFVGFLIAAFVAICGGLRLRALLLSLLLCLLVISPGLVADHTSEPALRVHFIPVGQGDATLIELPCGTTVLIDAGGRPVGADPGLTSVVPYLKHRGIKRLDAIVLTHAHYDHYGGIDAVARHFRPAVFYVDAFEDEPNVLAMRARLKALGTQVVAVDGRALIASPQAGLIVERPPLKNVGANDRSLVVSLSYAGVGLLFPGDLERAGESWLTDTYLGRRTVLKVPHHGSRTSSSDALLELLDPRIAIVSAGRHNRFGHPHDEVVARFEARGTDLFRTDLQGAIKLRVEQNGRMEVFVAAK